MSKLVVYTALVRMIFTTLDDKGMPIAEQVGPPTKVFRALTPDVWADADEAIAEAKKAEESKEVKDA